MAKAKCDECLKQIRTLHVLAYREFSDAEFLCNDCEQYVCSKCITKHVGHFTFALKDKPNETKLNQLCAHMLKQLNSERDETLEWFIQERIHICDVVDVVGEYNADFRITDVCILHESKKWAVMELNNEIIKVYNTNDSKMNKMIHLAYKPCNMTEIPSTDPSQSLIAVSFPREKLINIMNMNNEPAHAISSINVQGQCHDLANCNHKLITRCKDYLGGEYRDSIHVMNISGETINIIDLNKLPGIKLRWLGNKHMSVHPESETIYVCQNNDPPCVISLSLYGQVLHSVMLTDPYRYCICVDRDQTVYVMGNSFPLYKLSSDLSQIEKVIDEDFVDKWFSPPYHFTAIACHADTFYLARSDGKVVIIRHE